MNGHQPIPVNMKSRNDLFENNVACLVAECQEIIDGCLEQALMVAPVEMLVKMLWQGSIDPRNTQQELLGTERLQMLLSDLSAELSSLAAAVFWRPLLLHMTVAQNGLSQKEQVGVIGEQLVWSRETYFLNKTLKDACGLVWQRAVSDCAWPVRKLKMGELLWRLTGVTPEEEERRCQQELTKLVEAIKVNMHRRLFREISLQVATQVWLLFDDISTEKSSGAPIGTEKCMA